MERLWQSQPIREYCSQGTTQVIISECFFCLISEFVNSVFVSAVAGLEVEPLGQLCKILHRYDNALDMVALHKSITDLLFYSIQFSKIMTARLSASFSTPSVSSWADDQDR